MLHLNRDYVQNPQTQPTVTRVKDMRINNNDKTYWHKYETLRI